jgi:hypothetical protein
MLKLNKLSWNLLNKSAIKNFSKLLSVPLPMKDDTLEIHDPELFDLIEKEKYRQWAGLELIASENYASTAVMSCLGNFVVLL